MHAVSPCVEKSVWRKPLSPHTRIDVLLGTSQKQQLNLFVGLYLFFSFSFLLLTRIIFPLVLLHPLLTDGLQATVNFDAFYREDWKTEAGLGEVRSVFSPQNY